MDSIDQYVANSKRGGASGEITIRKSLVDGLRDHLQVDTDVATSDAEFQRLGQHIFSYRLVILDAWTWAGKGWVPKPWLRGHEARIFLLDFFGAKAPTRNGINVPASRILTAFPTSPWNTFLGYAIAPDRLPPPTTTKKRQGVLWGKDPKHFDGRANMLKALADQCDCELHSTLAKPIVQHPNIRYHGHLTPEEWQHLLAESKFMLGLGNPLVGPSAVDAVVAGCVYIDPTYRRPVKEVYHSQHPYLSDQVGPPHTCKADLEDIGAVQRCVQTALDGDVRPLVPKELMPDAYRQRLEAIFGKFLPPPQAP